MEISKTEAAVLVYLKKTILQKIEKIEEAIALIKKDITHSQKTTYGTDKLEWFQTRNEQPLLVACSGLESILDDEMKFLKSMLPLV